MPIATDVTVAETSRSRPAPGATPPSAQAKHPRSSGQGVAAAVGRPGCVELTRVVIRPAPGLPRGDGIGQTVYAGEPCCQIVAEAIAGAECARRGVAQLRRAPLSAPR